MLRRISRSILHSKGLLVNGRMVETTRLNSLSFKSRMQFSEENEPKGFEKFKRSPKKGTLTGTPPKNRPKEETKEVRKTSDDHPETEKLTPHETKASEQKVEVEPEKPRQEEKREDSKSTRREPEEEEMEQEEHSKRNEKRGQQNKQNASFSFAEIKKEFEKIMGKINVEEIFKNKKAYLKWITIAFMAGIWMLYPYFQNQWLLETIDYVEFVKGYLDKNTVSRIKVVRVSDGATYKNHVLAFTDHGPKKLIIGNIDHFLQQLEKEQLDKGRTKDQLIPVEFEYKADTSKVVDRTLNIVYLLTTIVIMVSLFRSIRSSMGGLGKGGQGDIFNFAKSGAKVFDIESQIKIRFKDVAGLEEAKQEITEFVDFLKRPKKYKDLGAKIPRGALLAGPPGTGKTLLAKAAAGEAGVPFLYISGSDFVEMFVGVGASRVRDLFKQAKSRAPSIIFIDEIDAVGRKRESKLGGNDERDSTLNQLLVEMDGFGTDTNVIILAATNRKELLDTALTRPGRFDRTIEVTLPDLDGRKSIFMVHLKPLKLDSSRTIEDYAKRLATLTPGFSGADIHNLCNEAAIIAARKSKTAITPEDFEMASERVLAGLEKKSIMSDQERRTVAVHESGHAVCSWFLEGGYPLLKLTIVPRSKGSLGFAQYLPSESSLETKEELFDRICCILGGRCAEEAFFGKITTGAYDDLQKVYRTAHALVTKFGMSEAIGFVGYSEEEQGKTYSEETNRIIDQEIKKIVDECTKRTRELIQTHKEHIDKLSTTLLEKETLDLQALVNLLGERPFAPKSNYKAYLDLKRADEAEKQQSVQVDAQPEAQPENTATEQKKEGEPPSANA